MNKKYFIINYRLPQYLASLAQHEHDLFAQYLQFPVFNTNKKLIKLYEELLEFAPAFDLTSADWEQVFQEMWPGRPFSKPELHSKMNVLLQLLKKFLSIQELEAQPQQAALLTLSQLRKRGLHKAFEAESKKLNKQLHAPEQPSAEATYLRYRLADEANAFYGQRQLRQSDTSLQAKIAQLDAYYLHVRLRESCELLNRHEVFNTPYEPTFFDQWLENLESENLPQPALRLYVQIRSCFRHPSDASAYLKLKEMLFQYADQFEPEEAYAMYRHGHNYCIRRINAGKLNYLQELFELYEEELASGLILKSGKIDHADYKNIITLGLRLKRFNWVSDFMEKYRDLVDEQYRDNVYHICKAELLYEQKQLSDAIRLLQQVNFSDIFYQMAGRTLLIKLYFERQEEEGLYYALDAFEGFLRRNKSIAKDRRESYRNFIICCRRLAKLRARKPILKETDFQVRWQKLQLRIQEIGKVANLVWLEEKSKTW